LLHTATVDAEALNGLFNVTSVTAVASRYRQMPLALKMAIPLKKLIVCSEFAEERVSNTVQLSFRKPFNMDSCRRASIYAQCKTQENKIVHL